MLNHDQPDHLPDLSIVRPGAEPSPADAWVNALVHIPHVSLARLLYVAVVKRALDLVAASVLFLLIAPLLVGIAAWIRLDSPGNPIFAQRRVGHGQRHFTIYKFRSMKQDADHLLELDPALKADYTSNWKLPNDPRTTGPGRILRKWSLDELPQLINVLKGDMSLIGPRPYMPHELANDFGDHAALITAVRPGITGLWQVSGRSHLTPADRIALDTRYVHTCGFRTDFLITLKTIKVVVFRMGAW